MGKDTCQSNHVQWNLFVAASLINGHLHYAANAIQNQKSEKNKELIYIGWSQDFLKNIC